jgi:hypothetical protein
VEKVENVRVGWRLVEVDLHELHWVRIDARRRQANVRKDVAQSILFSPAQPSSWTGTAGRGNVIDTPHAYGSREEHSWHALRVLGRIAAQLHETHMQALESTRPRVPLGPLTDTVASQQSVVLKYWDRSRSLRAPVHGLIRCLLRSLPAWSQQQTS